MAKRVAAQRRGLLYGLIATIFVAVILAVFLFIQINKTSEILKSIDPNAVEAAKVKTDLDNTKTKLKEVGLQADSLKGAIDVLIARNADYEQAIATLAQSISGQSPAGLHGDGLTSFVRTQDAAATNALANAARFVAIAPGTIPESDPASQAIKANPPATLDSAIMQLGSHINAMRDAYGNSRTTLQTYLANNEGLQASLERIKAADKEKLDQAVQERETTIAQLRETVAKLQEQTDEALKDKESTRTALLKAQNDAKDREQQLKNEIAQLNTQIQEISARLGRVTAAEVQPDGKIVRLDPGSSTGYINLAKGDGVMPGLEFSVFDPAELANKGNEAKRKGSVRIVNVMDDASEVYVTSSTRGNPIVEGDLIVNPVYSPQRRFHFALVGWFDIDKDGRNEIDIIKKMVERFGGKVDDKVGVQTDYLVVGTDPMSALPQNPTGSTSPMYQAKFDELSKLQLEMGDAVDFARRVWIPILNVNRFLSLVGEGQPSMD